MNQDPENPRVYMSKLMIEHKAPTPGALIQSLKTPLEEENLYQRAMRFADEEYKSQLESYARASHDKLEQDKLSEEAEELAMKEKNYQYILTLKSKAETLNSLMLDDLLKRVNALKPYKDTDKIFEEVSDMLRLERKYQDALRAKNLAETPAEWKNAVSQLESLGSYKDSEKLLTQARESLRKAEQHKRNMIIILVIAAVIALFVFLYYRHSDGQEKQRISRKTETQILYVSAQINEASENLTGKS